MYYYGQISFLLGMDKTIPEIERILKCKIISRKQENETIIDNIIINEPFENQSKKINQIQTIINISRSLILSSLTKIEKERLEVKYQKEKKIFEQKFIKEINEANNINERWKIEYERINALFTEYINKFYNDNHEFIKLKNEVEALEYELEEDDKFTESEYEIIFWYFDQRTTQEIAEILGYSINTINDKKKSIINKVLKDKDLRSWYVEGNQIQTILNIAPFIVCA